MHPALNKHLLTLRTQRLTSGIREDSQSPVIAMKCKFLNWWQSVHVVPVLWKKWIVTMFQGDSHRNRQAPSWVLQRAPFNTECYDLRNITDLVEAGFCIIWFSYTSLSIFNLRKLSRVEKSLCFSEIVISTFNSLKSHAMSVFQMFLR